MGSYIRPIGAGAVAASGLITLIKTMPTIFSALTAGIKDVRAKQAATAAAVSRTERDMSMRVVLIGSVVIVAMMWALLKFKPIPGAKTSGFADLLAALFVVVFGFLFVTVASRISGLIGNSSNPDQRDDDCDADGHVRGVSGDPTGLRRRIRCWR